MNTDSSVTIYKARIVAKSFWQVQGVDYHKIFSIVAMRKFVRIMLAIATFYEIWQMDVKTTFLNEFLKEELYMMQQEGFVNPKGANKVYKLQRSIYGLIKWSKHMVLYKLAVKPVLQESEWEHYNISDKYMWMTYCWSEIM